ncbi:hypothetical protein J6590_094057 [Homalodisca vitripennis]|nr:hypothetical protein J6590_094057 [Homalodisca vitripennis]
MRFPTRKDNAGDTRIPPVPEFRLSPNLQAYIMGAWGRSPQRAEGESKYLYSRM